MKKRKVLNVDALPWNADWTKQTRDVDLNVELPGIEDLPCMLLPRLREHPEEAEELERKMLRHQQE